jgi:hypothetical protein
MDSVFCALCMRAIQEGCNPGTVIRSSPSVVLESYDLDAHRTQPIELEYSHEVNDPLRQERIGEGGRALKTARRPSTRLSSPPTSPGAFAWSFQYRAVLISNTLPPEHRFRGRRRRW